MHFSPVRGTLILSDGSVLKGEILSESSDSLTLKTVFGTVQLLQNDILLKGTEGATTDSQDNPEPGASVRLESSYGRDENRCRRENHPGNLGNGSRHGL